MAISKKVTWEESEGSENLQDYPAFESSHRSETKFTPHKTMPSKARMQRLQSTADTLNATTTGSSSKKDASRSKPWLSMVQDRTPKKQRVKRGRGLISATKSNGNLTDPESRAKPPNSNYYFRDIFRHFELGRASLQRRLVREHLEDVVEVMANRPMFVPASIARVRSLSRSIPLNPSKQGRVLLLDMDETLLHTDFVGSPPAGKPIRRLAGSAGQPTVYVVSA